MFVNRIIGSCAVVLSLSFAAFGAGADLADAVMKKDRAAIRALIGQRADVNAAQADGATALHWAVYHNDLETADLLIRAGADVHVANRIGATPLSLACINGSTTMIESLLDAGADPNERQPNGETALMMAARTGSVEAMRVLLDRGADVNATENLRGTTALMWAAAYGNPPAVKLLIDRGADVSASTTAVPSRRRGGRVSIIRFSDDGVAQLGGGDDDPRSSLPGVEGGLTALVFAARQGDIESARILLAGGADVNQATADEWSPLLTATHNRHYQLGRLLLESGADPNIANGNGWTPLYIAVDNRSIEGGDYPTRKPDMDHLDYIKLLLEAGAEPNARMLVNTETRLVFTDQWLNEDGATAFLRAAQSSDVTVMRLLLEYGADPLIPTRNNTTALMAAAGVGWVEGITYEWSREENAEAVKMLIELGTDVNNIDDDGRTALHGAAHKGRNEIVQILADHGIRLDVRDKGSRDTRAGPLVGHGWQAIDYADGLVRVGVQSSIAHPETADLLRNLMTDAGLPTPPAGRTLESICITEACK